VASLAPMIRNTTSPVSGGAGPGGRLREYVLDDVERLRVNRICQTLDRQGLLLRDALEAAHLHAADLPVDLRQAFRDMKHRESVSAIVLRNVGYGLDAIPDTPVGSVFPNDKVARPYDLPHILFSACLGEVFTFSSIQEASLISDVFPVPGDANKPVSSNYQRDFALHTDDSFSEYAGEFLGLRALRNPDRVPTRLAAPDISTLSRSSVDALFEPVFYIRPNIAHDLKATPERTVPVFFGHRDRPYLRMNLNYDAAERCDRRHKRAYEELRRHLVDSSFDVVLGPGDCLYIDNFRITHGRMPYAPHFDGTDRWYRRVYIANDLRRTRHLRDQADGRIVHVT
jgi:L-asparagine oxygenase